MLSYLCNLRPAKMASGQDANPNLLPLLRGKLESVHAEIQQCSVSLYYLVSAVQGEGAAPRTRALHAAPCARALPPPARLPAAAFNSAPAALPSRAAQADLDAFKARIDSKSALAAKAAAAAGLSPAPGGAGGSRGQTQESVRRRIDVRRSGGIGGGSGARAGSGGRARRACARARDRRSTACAFAPLALLFLAGARV